jgi:hypothetical protein
MAGEQVRYLYRATVRHAERSVYLIAVLTCVHRNRIPSTVTHAALDVWLRKLSDVKRNTKVYLHLLYLLSIFRAYPLPAVPQRRNGHGPDLAGTRHTPHTTRIDVRGSTRSLRQSCTSTSRGSMSGVEATSNGGSNGKEGASPKISDSERVTAGDDAPE